jgi:hypothetical protein
MTKCWAWVLVSVALLLLDAVAVVPLLLSVGPREAPAGYSRLFPVHAIGANAEATICSPGVAQLIVDLHQLDVSNRFVSANLSMCIGETVATQLVRDSRRTRNGIPTLTIPGSAFTTSLLPIAREQLATGGYAEPIGSVSLATSGNPGDYPKDRYDASFVANTLQACGADVGDPLILWMYVDPAAAEFSWYYRVPHRVLEYQAKLPPRPISPPLVGAAPGLPLASFTSIPSAPPYYGSIQAQCDGGTTGIVLEAGRPGSTWVLIVIVLLLPAVGGLLLSGWLAAKGGPSASDWLALAGVATGLFAVVASEVLITVGVPFAALTYGALLLESLVTVVVLTLFWYVVWPRLAASPDPPERAPG